MSLVSKCLEDAERKVPVFKAFPSNSIEIGSSSSGPFVTKHELNPENIRPWIDQTGLYQLKAEVSQKCSLRLLYQKWTTNTIMPDQNTIPFSEDVFHYLSTTFGLPTEYLYFYLQNRYTPLHVTLPNKTSKRTTMVFQSPLFQQFSTLVLSYDPSARVTYGFLGYNETLLHDNLIKMLLQAQEEAIHPLLLPMLYYHLWTRAFANENEGQKSNMSLIKKVTKGVSSPSSRSHDFQEVNEAHELIIGVHNTLNNSMGSFVSESAHNLECAFSNIQSIVGEDQMEVIYHCDQQLRAMLSILGVSRIVATGDRIRLRERLHIQLQVLYNMIQQIDSKRIQAMTDSSMKIAADSKELTARSKEIAEKTMLDGSAMKTIAIVTMIFLPGTAIATILSMSSFFEAGSDGSVVISAQFWIYWTLTIPVTIIVLGSWWFSQQRQAQEIRRLEIHHGSESLLSDVGSPNSLRVTLQSSSTVGGTTVAESVASSSQTERSLGPNGGNLGRRIVGVVGTELRELNGREEYVTASPVGV